MKIKPGNIYSGDRERAVFTNPTCLAKRKGNLRGDYPVTIDGRTFPDAEAAYQALAAGCKNDTERCYEICTRVISAKLDQHPRILQTIRESGGYFGFIVKCSHWVGYRKKNPGRWEGDGLDSGFIRCLARAYESRRPT